jgi:hypothetical protein
MKMLIIENDFLTAELMRTALMGAGHSVIGPTMGAELGIAVGGGAPAGRGVFG